MRYGRAPWIMAVGFAVAAVGACTPGVDPSHLIQKCLHHRTVKRQRRRQLQEERPSFIGQSV